MSGVRFSLVVATCGRSEEVKALLNSLTLLDYEKEDFEVVLVDQNDRIDLGPVVSEFQNKLFINHIRTTKKGGSVSRNIGIENAKFEQIAFPDDDCLYYHDTLKLAASLFARNPDCDALLGRIVDRKTRKKILKRWKDKPFHVNRFNFFRNFSMITLFYKKNACRFDENIGIGTPIANEDTDFILNLLDSRVRIQYRPEIEVWHPEQPMEVFPAEKIKSYGLGFGFVCRKRLSLPTLALFTGVIIYHILFLAVELLSLKRGRIVKKWLSVYYRVIGFFRPRVTGSR